MSNLHLKKKDDIFIKLTECLDRSSSSNYLSNTPIEARSVNHGWVLALKWVLGYDELYEQENPLKPISELAKEMYESSDDEIDMNKL
tara:strand:+ start:522 stop:782 length:261 start_codon:yes stop_codon:yes gene_type:complete